MPYAKDRETTGRERRYRANPSPREMRPLSAREQRFVDEYMKCLSATGAIRATGYTGNHAYTIGARILRRPCVQAAIKKRQALLSTQTTLDGKRVIAELVHIAASDIGDLIDFTDQGPQLKPAANVPERLRRAIASVKVRRYVEGKGEDARVVELIEFKLWPKVQALELLGKYFGLWAGDGDGDGKPDPAKLLEQLAARHSNGGAKRYDA